MAPVRPTRRRAMRSLIAALAAGIMVVALPVSANAQSRPHHGGKVPHVNGLGTVAQPAAAKPLPLPKRTGKIAVTNTHIAVPQKTTAIAPKAATSKAAAAATTTNNQVALRALIVATDPNDWGVATWKTTLDRVGVAYDILYTSATAVTAGTFLRSDGVGRYNAILLTNTMQIYVDGSGNYVSALDGTEWNTLWAYERDFGVRQAALYTSYGTYPEDYCLTASSETSIGDTPVSASITAAGASVFDYLKSTATLPIQDSYVYQTTLTPGCSASAALTMGGKVVGVQTTSTDGRERLALTFTSNQYLLQSDLLVYGLARWATKGLYTGDQRHYLNVDIDDWFNSSDERLPNGTIVSDPGWQDTAHDAYNLDTQQKALRTAYPVAGQFVYNLPYNGGDIQPGSNTVCSPNGGISQLTSTTRCLATHFHWVNHTLTHPRLDSTDYATTYGEINNNLVSGRAIGLTPPTEILKTPEYSGLGVYPADITCDTCTPVDHGLMASNPAMLQAAKAVGVKYLHGNMSFPSEVPANYNTNIVHPMEPTISIVPDWPTNIAYFSTTPDEETSFYNSYYGPGGLFPYWSTNQTYAQIIDYESGLGLQHVVEGSINVHTFHISNTNDYGSGKTLVGDWVKAVVSKYATYYSAPLLNLAWTDLAKYTTERDAHFAELSAGADPVYDRSTGKITVKSPAAGTLEITGATSATARTYNGVVTSPVVLAANTTVTLTAVPRS